jgi:pimeloyl-ACP methyl ester carboxylesterase
MPRTLPGITPARALRLRRLFRVVSAVSPALAARLALSLYLRPGRRKLDAVDAPLLAEARQNWSVLPAGRIRVLEWGFGPKALLLVHGWGSHAPRYSAFVDRILDRGWRAVAFDAPGHGASDGHRASLEDFRAALDSVVATHGPFGAVVGHSFGAVAVASLLAEQPPEGLRSAALISMPRDGGYLLDSFLMILEVSDAVAGRVRERFRQRFGHSPEGLSSLQMAPRIQCPILLVHDRDDDVVPLSQAQEVLAALPDGALHITQGLGHSGMLRDPATVGSIIGFLEARL